MAPEASAVDQVKREHILGKAREVFSQYGYKKASVDEIAQRAGVAKGTVYLAAESKSELFFEVLVRELRDWNAEVNRTLDPTLPADQLLLFAARRGIETLDQRPLLKALFLLETDEILPDLRHRFTDLRAIGIANISELIRIGIRQGLYRDDLDVEEVATLMLELQTATIVFHVKDTPLDDPDLAARLDRRAMATFDLLMNGLRPR